MNVYDFDRTLYPKDCSIQFYKFCLKKHIGVLKCLPRASVQCVKWWVGGALWDDVMGAFFTFLKYLPERDLLVEEFWDREAGKIYPYYAQIKREDDLIISASPDFMIAPIARRLGIRHIATEMDSDTGFMPNGELAGEKKRAKFLECFPNENIDCFYSDSRRDEPLARMAKHAFLIVDGTPTPWDFE